MKPKVVILSAFLTPHRSGAEACVEEVSRRLAHRYDLTIVTTRWKRSFPKTGTFANDIRLVRVGFGSTFDKWLFPFLAPFAVRKLKPDLIHTVLESYAGMAMVFCKFLMPYVPRILTLQSTNTDALLGPMHKTATTLTAISTVLIERAKKWKRNDVALIPNGLPVKEIRDAVSKNKKVDGRILFVGRLRPMKAVDVLLQAFAIVLESSDREDLHLRLVGEGFQEQMLKQVAKDLNIEKHVTFVGYLPVAEVHKEFAQAPIFACLSRHEAFGNVFVEAQAAQCAIVGTNIEGIPEIVTDGKTGLLVPVNDKHAAAEAILTLLSDDQLRSRLTENGLENVEKYDWDLIAHQYAEVYDAVLSRTN